MFLVFKCVDVNTKVIHSSRKKLAVLEVLQGAEPLPEFI